MKALRNSFILPKRAIETFLNPGYIIRLQKERQKRAKRKKLHETDCRKAMSRPINHELFTKNIKNIWLQFGQMTRGAPLFVMMWKENKTYKIGRICKKLEYFLKKPVLSRKNDLRRIKPLQIPNCSGLDKWCDLSKRMLSYTLAEIRLANLRNQFFFSLKTNIFKVYSQQSFQQE